ncbi:MAG: hypothetical protein GF364_08105 [Candidatus Lokiarchaeota archaeon]|nr:hypothetical protein [Candidatus Lokiarchaeota archaeon]
MEMYKHVSPGIVLIGRYGLLDTGVWLFHHNQECAILEMPDINPKNNSHPKAWESVTYYIKEKKLNPKFITVTHAHRDHIDSFQRFHKAFQRIPILLHETFFKRGSYFRIKKVSNVIQSNDLKDLIRKKREPSLIYQKVPIYCWRGRIFKTDIGGEVLFLVHVPKHSLSDTMLIFRGTMITGDWWLGPGDPNKNHIPIRTINDSISFLQNFVNERNYRIRNLFSVHANEFRRELSQQNYQELLESTRRLA